MIDKILIVCGWGNYPRHIVEGAKRAGVRQVDVVAIRGSTCRATWKAADHVHWITLGTIPEGIRWASAQHYDGVILAGQVNPLALFRGRFGDEVRGWLDSLPVKTAHTIFSKLISEFDKAGLHTLPASCYLDDYLPGVGALTVRGLNEVERQDALHGLEVARDVGRHDVGQTVMVRSGMVLAVEAFEGTNAAIRRGGKLGGRGAVVFKGAREGHDMRFDIPVVGIKTLRVMRRAGATALAFQAGRLVMLDREAVVRYADAHGIAIVGLESGLPPAPLRPE